VTADFTGQNSTSTGSQLVPPFASLAATRQERALQGADFLRRLLKQVAGVRLLDPAEGEKVRFLTPAPAADVIEALSAAGARVEADGPWESTLAATVGWWHRRTQLVGLATGVAAFLTGAPVPLIEEDQLDEVPQDLPRRRLGTIDRPDQQESI
jgi:hypothetical protein